MESNEERKKILDEIRKSVIYKKEELEIQNGEELPDSELKKLIKTEIRLYTKKLALYLSPTEKQNFTNSIFNAMRGLGILQPLLDDESVTEIMVNGPDCIFIEKDGNLFEYDKKFESEEQLEEIVRSIVEWVNREINPSHPIADARLKDGSRVNAVVKPVALNGPILTIRKFSEDPITIAQMIEWESINQEVSDFLKIIVKAKYNIFIAGGTGSGKTTFLNALSNFIPKDERIITIEDSAELQILNVKNLVKLETKTANVEGKGEISMKDLIKSSLRMRPDRIVVGEVRGGEALDMLQAMNTGHDGSLSTGHANSTKDMLTRIETMVLSGVDMPLDAIRNQISSALDIIIHLGRMRDKTRKVLTVSEVLDYKDGEIKINPLYKFDDRGDDEHGKVIGELVPTGNSIINNFKLKQIGIKNLNKVLMEGE